MTIKEMVRKFLHKDGDFKEMQRQDRLQNVLEARKKNSNERELERYLEEERQKRIKIELEAFRKQHQDEFFHGPSILKQKNIFKRQPGDKGILHQDFDILNGGKKMFMIKSNNLNSKGGF